MNNVGTYSLSPLSHRPIMYSVYPLPTFIQMSVEIFARRGMSQFILIAGTILSTDECCSDLGAFNA